MSTATKSMAQPLMGSSSHTNQSSSGSYNSGQNNNSNGPVRNDAGVSKVFVKNVSVIFPMVSFGLREQVQIGYQNSMMDEIGIFC